MSLYHTQLMSPLRSSGSQALRPGAPENKSHIPIIPYCSIGIDVNKRQHGSHIFRLTNFPDFSSIFFSIFQYFFSVLLSTGSGRHSTAAHEIRLICCYILLILVPKTIPGTSRLFPEPPRSPFGRLAPLEVMHLFNEFNRYKNIFNKQTSIKKLERKQK